VTGSHNTRMIRCRLASLSAIAIFIGAARAQEIRDPTGIASLPNFERHGIEKIAKLTAQDHSMILFTIADETIGFAKDGAVGRIGRDWIGHCNRWTHPALSHGGRLVAYVSDGESEGRALDNCRIAIHNPATGIGRTLMEIGDDPGEISWSWDDTRIVYFDRQRGLSEVSVANSVTQRLTYGLSGSSWVWYPMQWLHNDLDLVVERSERIPAGPPGTFREQSKLFQEGTNGEHLVDLGSEPVVSPLSDRIAYYAHGAIATINADGTGRKVLARAPRSALFFHEELFGNLVWSPDGQRLFFGTIVSEDRSDKVYLLDVKSGRSQQFLSHTSIRIRGWR
jgi:hypothetical protein